MDTLLSCHLWRAGTPSAVARATTLVAAAVAANKTEAEQGHKADQHEEVADQHVGNDGTNTGGWRDLGIHSGIAADRAMLDQYNFDGE